MDNLLPVRRRALKSCQEENSVHQFKGTGEIVSSTVVHQAQTGYEMFGPYCIAIVKLDEGPQITTQIVDCEPENVKPGMKVKSVFRKLGEDSESGILHYGTKFIINEDNEVEETEENLPDIEV